MSDLARRHDARLTLARDLRDILTDESRTRRESTFAATELALAERKHLLADRQVNVSELPPPVIRQLEKQGVAADEHLPVSVTPQLATQQTKLRGAHDLLQKAEADGTGQASSLSKTTRLTETALTVQVARQQTDTQPVDPSDVAISTQTVSTPDHDTPVAATLAILEAQDTELTDAQAADLQVLEALPVSTRQELTDVLDAYLVYYRTVEASNGTDVRRVRAAQLQLLDAAAELEAALDDTDALESVDSASHTLVGPVQIEGVVSIDLSTRHNTYTEDYLLQIDAAGHDTYNNNAGGATASGNSTAVAALIDLGGHDTYNGRNGGARYRVTKESPSPPVKDKRLFLPKKGEAAGFLLDVGTGDDTYNAEMNASNGGGSRASGFLVDVGGDDNYNGTGQGTNGAGYRKGTGFLLDVGTGEDTYAAGDEGVSNGAGGGGHGLLFDVGGNDTYRGSNGGAHLPVENNYLLPFPLQCETDPREVDLRDTACQIYFFFAPTPMLPESGGFLLDGGGTDMYEGANGGADWRASAFLLDAGTGNDTYEGKNGGATNRAAGFLLDIGGTDHYVSDRPHTRNGAGRIYGVGFLLDGGVGDDTYNATAGGGPSASQWSQHGPGSLGANGGAWQGGHGFLVDSGGNDAYLAGSVGTNGGATGGTGNRLPGAPSPFSSTGFLLDTSGDDRYEAGQIGVNGGAGRAAGLLYDNAGTDNYTERYYRCIDCSDIPKGSVGAQVDRGSGGENISRRTGPTEVLVVDDTTETGHANCPDAAYEAIQPAVDAAEPGDTIRVCAGTYPGNVTVNTRNVRVEAAVPGQVVLEGAHERRVGIALVAPQTTVTGVTARNFSVGFTAVGRATTVRNTTSSNNTRGILAAGLYSGGALQALPVSVSGSDEKQPTVIADNTVRDGKQGISVTRTGNVRVVSNTVKATQHGISLLRGTGITIQNNTVSGQGVPVSKHQGGIASVRSWDITITGNRVTNFTAPAHWQEKGAFRYGYGIQIRGGVGGKDQSHTLRDNRLADNRFNLMFQAPKTAYQHFTITPSNTVDGKPVVYLVGAVGATIGPSGISNLTLNSSLVPDTALTNTQALGIGDTPGYVACVNCIGVTVRNLELSRNGHGVLFVKSRAVEVTNVTVHDTVYGIALRGSPTNAEVTNNTVRDTNIAVNVRHKCDPRKRGFRGTYRTITRAAFELCANPSVLVAHNTIRRSSRGFNGLGGGEGVGGAIMVNGPGVMVRQNAISHVHGAGINIRGGPTLTSQGAGLFGTGITLPSGPIFESTVRDNAISDARVGISVKGTQGTTVAENTIRNTVIGLYTLQNNGITYRANTVTNTTTGMFVHWTEVSLTARNNRFRDVRWGLDGRFLYAAKPPHAPSTHDFGTSNRVNGERILWLTGAVGRTINAADANMVVCVRCIDVTIQDMTLTDNAHGVVLWDTTATRVRNVRVTDTFRTGVLIRGGQNNTVRDSTIIDSSMPIFAYPIKPLPSQLGRTVPVTVPTRELSKNVGPVHIVNNRIAVDDASWPNVGTPYWSDPDGWGHYGIALLKPTEATIIDNDVMANNWGVLLKGGQVSDIRIVNNAITSPRREQGFDRFGDSGGLFGSTFGARVQVGASDSANSSLTIRNNTLTASPNDNGIMLKGRQFPSTTVVNNSVQGYQKSLKVSKRSTNTTVSVRRNRFVGAKAASVVVVGLPAGQTVEIHQNLLNPLRFGYGVKYKKGGGGGGHMSSGGAGGSGGGHMATTHHPVDATCNRWAAPTGPSSQRMTLLDPVTGAPADGNGSFVSSGPMHKGSMHGKSNVHFHPWIGESPGRTCSKELVGTKTPTPTPGPTRTPWPTAESGDANGTGPGPGDGPGSGDGNDTGPGPGTATAAGGGEGTSTATARVAATDTPTGTPPPTATPEIVPGFGVGVWLVAFALLVAVLAARRRG